MKLRLSVTLLTVIQCVQLKVFGIALYSDPEWKACCSWVKNPLRNKMKE